MSLLLAIALAVLPTGRLATAGTQSTGAGVWVPSGITQVQKKLYAATGALTTHTVTLDSTATSGNLLILCVVGDATANTPSGWTLAVSGVSLTGTYIYYKTSNGTESSIGVTLTATTTAVITAFEYSGMAASSQLDQTASTQSSTGSSISTGTTGTTAQASELLIAAVGMGDSPVNTVTVSSWSNSFTAEAGSRVTGGTIIGGFAASQIVSSTGTYSSTATLSGSSTGASAVIATFKGQ